MELKPVGILGDCFEPDQTYAYNFMLDTSAINKLAEKPQDVDTLAQASTKLGYLFFRCRIQDGEVVGMKSDGSFHKNFSGPSKKAQIMQSIIETLPIRKIPCVGALVQGGIPLDGTCYFLEDNGKYHDLFKQVFNENPDNVEDAMIVESGIHHNCTIISNDRAMCENTNAIFPNKAMWYDRFIKETKEKLV